MKNWKSWTLFLAFSLFLPLNSLGGAETGFLKRSVELKGVTYAYQVYLPPDWTSDEKWPVVLFLHGAGERGADGSLQTSVGLPRLVRRGRSFPGVLVMPQCRRGTWWGEAAMEALVLAALERTIREFNGDPQRVSLTGLSMGGYGAWALGYKYPHRFAALAPICGGMRSRGYFQAPDWHPVARFPNDPYQEAARGIGTTPVWAFHGAADPVVPVDESRKLVEALKAGGANVKYTEFPGVRHNSWDRAYSEQGLIDWLLAQRLNR